VERPETDETLANFRLDAGPRSGAVALTADRVTAGYGVIPSAARDLPPKGIPRSARNDTVAVVHNFSMTVRRGERYAIMGPNGSGKSTLLKTFAGRLQPLAGAVTYGHNVHVGYYDQTLGDLNPHGKVIDEVWNLDHSLTEEQVRSYLAQFSFFDDDVFKKTRDLSGGEKGRLALAKIMYAGGNLMLLDEPTNHLDVYTREALEEALEAFTGALIVVSHDRYFIDRVAENLIVVEDGAAEVLAGNYSEVTEKLKAGVIVPKKPEVVVVEAPPQPAAAHDARHEQRKRDKKLRKIDEEIAALEERIASAERERERNDLLLCSEEVFRDGPRVKKIHQQNSDLKAMIDLLYRKWEALAKEKEEVTA
jgi:ATP-binding cassette, subfamily F, member 3